MNGISANNSSLARITDNSLGLSMISMPGEYVNFYIPRQVGTYNYEKIFTDYQVVKITDIVYLIESEMTGTLPFNADVQYLVNVPCHSNYETGCICGLGNINPIQLGTDVDSGSSCLIGFDYHPDWITFFHEMWT